MRVLVTGATGFLGSHIAEALQARGDIVRATVRRSSKVERLTKQGIELALVSLESGEGLDEALRDVDAVIHCAGGGRVTSDAEFHTQNVTTTETLLRAIERVRPNLHRFVHASSVAAVPARSQYGKAKLDAEKLVLESSSRVRTTLLRLPILYGPRDPRWINLYRTVSRGIQPVLGGGNAVSILYATDAASSLIAPLDREHASGAIYSPNDGTPVNQRELGRMVGESIGKKALAVRIPGSVLLLAARASELAGKMSGREVFLTRDKVIDLIGDDWISDSSSIRNELGWSSKVSLSEGTRFTAAWLREEGLL